MDDSSTLCCLSRLACLLGRFSMTFNFLDILLHFAELNIWEKKKLFVFSYKKGKKVKCLMICMKVVDVRDKACLYQRGFIFPDVDFVCGDLWRDQKPFTSSGIFIDRRSDAGNWLSSFFSSHLISLEKQQTVKNQFAKKRLALHVPYGWFGWELMGLNKLFIKLKYI